MISQLHGTPSSHGTVMRPKVATAVLDELTSEGSGVAEAKSH